ncbi:LysE family translocator [Burkholderia anthina]|uniref:LysE family translocator n=1 Tax=Burkholderia anthina TaxID=179879 RepID=UPI000A8758FF|nr:LysE family transporter [Burkholderia anthina]
MAAISALSLCCTTPLVGIALITMHPTLTLLSISGTLLLAAMSPGPSFVTVAQVSVSHTRSHGIAAAFGMGVGALVFAVLALAGFITLLAQVEWLYVSLRVAGGLYLLWMGLRMWRTAAHPLARVEAASGTQSPARSFQRGLITQLSNPKTAVVYASVFSALLPAHPSHGLTFAIIPAVFFVESGWYCAVATGFASNGLRSLYLRGKVAIDRCAGAIVAALGAKLIHAALYEF